MSSPDYYIYQADVYCEDCAKAIKARLKKAGLRPKDYKDETTFDSGDWPKGPYSDEESDSPEHCGSGAECLDPTEIDGEKYGKFLENPLTIEGQKYVLEQHKESPSKVTEFWLTFYDYIEVDEPDDDAEPTEPEEGDYTTADHCKFYQYDKLVVECKPEDDHVAAVRAHMEKEQFWPSVWFISDHGNAHLIDMSEEKENAPETT